jgi:hypothetical protein
VNGPGQQIETPDYLTAIVKSDNQKAGGSSEAFAGGGGGSLMGLAPATVANINSIIASPEQNDFFIDFFSLT